SRKRRCFCPAGPAEVLSRPELSYSQRDQLLSAADRAAFTSLIRTVLRAIFAARRRTSSRLTVQLNVVVVLPPSQARPTQTSQTGRSGPASPGPAIPTVLTARSVFRRVRQPTAIASATSALTAPRASIKPASTPSHSTFSRLS